MRIGITDCYNEDKYHKYVDWIHGIDPSVEFVKLSAVAANIDKMDTIDGLLLTGGGDIDIAFYDSTESPGQAKSVNRSRDEFEFEAIKRALEDDLPIMGVCRGMQVMNVALGGTLHVDLQASGFNDHAGIGNGDMRHGITIEPNSLLSGLAGGLQQEVNSHHHQAVHRFGKGLMPVAQSPDGVIEAAEWSMKEGMPFLLLVQWHPERLTIDNTFSSNLAKILLQEIEHSKASKTTITSRR